MTFISRSYQCATNLLSISYENRVGQNMPYAIILWCNLIWRWSGFRADSVGSIGRLVSDFLPSYIRSLAGNPSISRVLSFLGKFLRTVWSIQYEPRNMIKLKSLSSTNSNFWKWKSCRKHFISKNMYGKTSPIHFSRGNRSSMYIILYCWDYGKLSLPDALSVGSSFQIDC